MNKPLRHTTRQHRSGDGLVINIPTDLAFADADEELEIEAVGTTTRGDFADIRGLRLVNWLEG